MYFLRSDLTVHAITVFWTAALLAAIPAYAAAQSIRKPDSLLTRPGWEVGGQLARYHYEEPSFAKLTGSRAGAVVAYTFTEDEHLYLRLDLRSSYGALKYEGSGTLDDVPDWISEARAVFGKDYLAGSRIALSPYVGLGYRYLSNDLRGYTSTGAAGYRRKSEYVYAPVGLTLRIGAGAQWVVAAAVEYDYFISGQQRSKLADAGVGFMDVTNRQDGGRGRRASLMIEKGHWAFGPWIHYWNIKASDTRPIGLGFAALEPANWTREYGLELRYRF